MSERYSRLFTLPENLYAVGSPVVIAAGTLLKDNQTGKIVAQLKLRSISNKVIRAVKVSLSLFDTAGNPIGNVVEYEYLDLDASRDTEFGQKNPVFVSESKARSYEVAVSEVVFADRTTWTASDAEWEPLPRQKTLDAVFVNAELVKQYKIAVGSNFTYYPSEEKDLWYCACGALNHEGEACHVCNRTLFELQTIDLDQLAKDKDARLAQEASAAEAKAAAEKAAAEAAKKKTAKILKIAIPVVCAVIAFVIFLNSVIIPNSKYNKAISLMEAGQYEEAIAAFETMGGYKDSVEQIVNCENAIVDAQFAKAEELLEAGDYDGAIAIYESLADKGIAAAEEGKLQVAYKAAEALAENGKTVKAAIAFGKLGDYKASHDRSMELWGQVKNLHTISVGGTHIVALKSDGTVVAAGNNENGQCEVSGWKDIVSVSAGNGFTVGLRKDGTVVAIGYDDNGRLDVGTWKDIVSIETGFFHTLGIADDGTVYAAGGPGVSGNDNVQLCGAYDFTVALKSNGTVALNGSENSTKCNVSGWKDIVSIRAGAFYIVGLKADGTVIFTGQNKDGQSDIEKWDDIVTISSGAFHIVGLKSDATVVAVGLNDYGRCDVSAWKDIVAVYAGGSNTVGLKADGTIVVIGSNKYGQLAAANWTNIKLPN